jgi:hypothetical protein
VEFFHGFCLWCGVVMSCSCAIVSMRSSFLIFPFSGFPLGLFVCFYWIIFPGFLHFVHLVGVATRFRVAWVPPARLLSNSFQPSPLKTQFFFTICYKSSAFPVGLKKQLTCSGQRWVSPDMPLQLSSTLKTRGSPPWDACYFQPVTGNFRSLFSLRCFGYPLPDSC